MRKGVIVLDSIITYLLLYNQYLLKIISQLLLFIAKHIPLKQWAFDDSHSPEYQKFKVDKLPKRFNPDPIDYQLTFYPPILCLFHGTFLYLWRLIPLKIHSYYIFIITL